MCVCEHYTLYILPSVLVQLKLSARMHSEGCFVSVCVRVCVFVRYHVFCDYAQRDDDTNRFIDHYTGLIFKKGDFDTTFAFKSYDVKGK